MRYLIASLCLIIATPALACSGMSDSKHHNTPKLCKKLAKNQAVKGYIAANNAMHNDMRISYTGDADIDFVEGMIPHHQGAVDMAKVQLQHGTDPVMRKLAKWIVRAQVTEIGQMNSWISGRRSNWRADNAESLPAVLGYKAAMEKMHHDMRIQYTGNADIDFAKGMIPHHLAAIEMAWVLKKHGRDFTLQKLADDIIRSQTQEIKLMQEWLENQKSTQKSTHKKDKQCHGHTSH